MLSTYMGFWDTWDASLKVSFDGPNKLILINPGVVSLDVKLDIYSAWKLWMLFNEANNFFYLECMIALGGDPISDTAALGSTFFLENGWRIKPWDGHTSINITGNIYVREGGRPIVSDNNGVDAVSLTVSNLVDTVIIDTSTELDTEAPTWVGAVGITDIYQDSSTIAVRWGVAIDNKPDAIKYNIYVSKISSTVFETYNLLQTVEGNLTDVRFEDLSGTLLQSGVEYHIGVRAIDIAGNETTNINYGSIVYVSTLFGENDVNIISVAGTSVTSVDDFKADTVNVDLSGIPADVWSYVSRELTVSAGLTPEQEITLNQILSDVNSTLDANILSVTGTPVINVDDFKAENVVVDAVAIAAEIFNTDIHLYNDPYTVGEVLHRLDYIGAKIYVDTNVLVNGHGSQKMPFDNVNDAKDYAELNGIRDIVVSGDIIVPNNLKNMTIWGIGLPTINFNGQDIKNSRFNECILSGAYTSPIIAEKCIITPGFEIAGWFDTCAFTGEFVARGNTDSTLVDCLSGIPGIGRPSLNMNASLPSKVGIRGWRGGLDVTNCDHIDDVITVEVAEGSFRFTNTCVAGEMVARGTCKFVDETNGATVYDETSYKENISKTIWSETIRSLTEPVLLEQTVIDEIVTSVPSLSQIRDEMINVQFGKLEITNNQMLVWDKTGTLLVTYDLFDAQGLPTMNMVYRREVV